MAVAKIAALSISLLQVEQDDRVVYADVRNLSRNPNDNTANEGRGITEDRSITGTFDKRRDPIAN